MGFVWAAAMRMEVVFLGDNGCVMSDVASDVNYLPNKHLLSIACSFHTITSSIPDVPPCRCISGMC